MQPKNKKLRDEAFSYFNQPVLSMFEVARCVGYGEDDDDCYYILQYPNRADVSHVSCVGGLISLECLKGQGEYIYAGESGFEVWDNFRRLAQWLAPNGAPKAGKFIEEYEGSER